MSKEGASTTGSGVDAAGIGVGAGGSGVGAGVGMDAGGRVGGFHGNFQGDVWFRVRLLWCRRRVHYLGRFTRFCPFRVGIFYAENGCL